MLWSSPWNGTRPCLQDQRTRGPACFMTKHPRGYLWASLVCNLSHHSQVNPPSLPGPNLSTRQDHIDGYTLESTFGSQKLQFASNRHGKLASWCELMWADVSCAMVAAGRWRLVGQATAFWHGDIRTHFWYRFSVKRKTRDAFMSSNIL